MLAAALLALGAAAAHAHKASDAYLTIGAQADRALLRVDVALRDLDRELDLDADGDGQLTWGEVRARWDGIAGLVTAAVKVQRGGSACTAGAPAAAALENHSDGAYAVLQWPLDCAAGTSALAVEYRLFEHTDPLHRALVRVQRTEAPPPAADAAGETTAAPLAALPAAPAAETAARAAAGRADLTVLRAGPGWQAVGGGVGGRVGGGVGGGVGGDDAAAAVTPAAGGFWHFAAEGLRHIASGLDHVLFLATLAMVVVFRREGPRWQPREAGASAGAEALRVVTAFTAAHSVTLALAVTGVASPPARGVETVIAASVFIAAIDNLRPLLPLPRWVMAGLFGLAHGFGFAGPLQSLGLSGSELVVPLLAFNLGVEAGQLAIVGLMLPLLLAWRGRRVYRRRVVPWASGAIATLALVWVVERAFDLQLLAALWPSGPGHVA